MPEHNPYGERLPTAPPVVRTVDRGPDPRRIVAETLAMVGQWDHIDYSQIIADVALMRADDDSCGFCNEIECDTGCPMARWRGQS
jgi:hypothetical protein